METTGLFFTHENEEVYLDIQKYPDNSPKLVIKDSSGGNVAVLSLHYSNTAARFINFERLEPGDIIIKDYSENKRIATDAGKSGIFFDTGKRIQSGWVVVPVWRFVNESLLKEV